MKEVDNGRGLRIQPEYKPMADRSVVTSVAEDGLVPTLANRESTPTKQWVVSKIRVNKGQSGDPATMGIVTGYTYEDPKYIRVDDATRFRGFGTARITSPDNLLTVEDYGYDVDPTGRLTKKSIYPNVSEPYVHQVELTTWAQSEVETGSWFIYPSQTLTYVCDARNPNDLDNYNACTAKPPLREEQFVQIKESTDNHKLAAVWRTESAQQLAGSTDGDRRTDKQFLYLSSEELHVLYTVDEQSLEYSGTQFQDVARTRWGYQEETGVLLYEDKFIDGTNYSRTAYSDHTDAGQPKTITKPNATGGTNLEYDNYMMYVVESEKWATDDDPSEPDHVVFTETDFGTGKTTRARGPHSRDGQLFETVNKIDGFGRVEEQWVSVDATSGYTLTKISDDDYDYINNKFTSKRLIEFDEGRWTESVSTFDGAGRIISKVTEAGTTDAVESFVYDNLGRLSSYTAPDPSQSSSTVTFDYTFDTLGRILSVTPPAAMGGHFDTSYDGRTTTAAECFTSVACETDFASKKSTRTDHFGRLVEVNEYVSLTETADTTYAFELNNKRMFDAENQETLLVHDFLGRRTEIHRAGRVHRYQYDANGNMTAEIAPNLGNEAPYTTTTNYDGHDRITSHWVREREQTAGFMREEYGVGTTYYSYGQSGNELGRLVRVDYPSEPGQDRFATYLYDARGNVTAEERAFFLPSAGKVALDGVCSPEVAEACDTSSIDCGDCEGVMCGDGHCQGAFGEDCNNCSADCGTCNAGAVCGDGACDELLGENCNNCFADCAQYGFICYSTMNCPGWGCQGHRGEDCNTCTADCGVCSGTCGNGQCEGDFGESCSNCESDCGACAVPEECGNGVCEVALGESSTNCPADCQYFNCGDGTCSEELGEECNTCPSDCGACDGGAFCAGGWLPSCQGARGESCENCPSECGTCDYSCGNGYCDAGEGEDCNNCSADCGACWDPSGSGECGTGECQEQKRESCQTCDDCPVCEAFGDRRTVLTEYNALGQIRLVRHADGDSDDTRTVTRYHYGIRGLPERVELVETGGNTVLARLERNVAGVPTVRYSHDDGQYAIWDYDELGRVVRMSVVKASGLTIARHDLSYGAFGDVASLTQTGPSSIRTLVYDYDLQHQLTMATETTGGGFDADYGYTAAGRLNNASLTPGPAAPALLQSRARNVTYNYGIGTDPQAVDALDNNAGGGTFATFTYDLSGNITQRTEPGATWDFVYDGDDLQRRVTYMGNTETYFYGQDNQRSLAIEKIAGSLGRTRFFFDATEVWYDNRGRPTKSLVTVNLGQSVARIERANENRDIKYPYHSTLQHLIVVLDDQASIEAGFFYGPFGEVIEEVSSANDYDRQFNDKHLDDFSALSYYGYRYYDSLSLAWTQADPMYRFAPDMAWEEPRKANLYAFSGQNPTRYLDPDGKDIFLAQRISKVASGKPLGFADTLKASLPPVLQHAVADGERNAVAYKQGGLRGVLEANNPLLDALTTGYDTYKAAGEGDSAGVAGGVVKLGLTVAAAVLTRRGGGGKGGGLSKTAKEMGAELAGEIGTNRVSVQTSSGRVNIDLAGRPHGPVPAPHVTTKRKPSGMPGGEKTGKKEIRSATKQDIRTARKVLERRRRRNAQ